MYIFSSCQDALKHCLDTQTFAIAHLYYTEKTHDIHIHDCHEIYYSISGGKQFLINNCSYNFEPGDVFFINPFESHHLLQLNEGQHERIVIHIHPEYLKKLSTERTDLSNCFSSRLTKYSNKCSLSNDEQKRFMYLMHELSSESKYGQELLDLSTFLKLMVFLNEIYAQKNPSDTKKISPSGKRYEQFNNILSLRGAYLYATWQSQQNKIIGRDPHVGFSILLRMTIFKIGRSLDVFLRKLCLQSYFASFPKSLRTFWETLFVER